MEHEVEQTFVIRIAKRIVLKPRKQQFVTATTTANGLVMIGPDHFQLVVNEV